MSVPARQGLAWRRRVPDACRPIIFRKGLDLKEAVAAELAAAYHSAIVDEVRDGRLRPAHRAG